MKPLRNAPSALIEFYEKRSKVTGQFVIGGAQRQVLGKLLSDASMKRAWNTIRKSLKTPEDYDKWFKAVIEAMRLARQGIAYPTPRKERYDEISKLSVKLRKLIGIPDKPPIDGSGYRGELDLQIYELLPEDVAKILGAVSWTTMTSHQRSEWAYSVLHQWPTMVDLLNELAGKARQKADEPVPARRRSRVEEETDTDDKIALKTKSRLFACFFDDELRKKQCTARGAAVISAMASVLYEVDISSDTIRKALFDHRRTVS